MRKVFHRIDEVPKTIIRNYSKVGPKHFNNPVIWIFTECGIIPNFCDAANYKEKVKELLGRSQKQYGLDGLLCWAYRVDLFPLDVKTKMTSEAANRDRYVGLLNK